MDENKIAKIDPVETERFQKHQRIKNDIINLLKKEELTFGTIKTILENVEWDINYNSILK